LQSHRIGSYDEEHLRSPSGLYRENCKIRANLA
jgi:hypothetical protein